MSNNHISKFLLQNMINRITERENGDRSKSRELLNDFVQSVYLQDPAVREDITRVANYHVTSRTKVNTDCGNKSTILLRELAERIAQRQ